MVLTYKDGGFLLIEGFSKKYLTHKAAVKYRKYSDSTAETIFSRILVKRYDLPIQSPPLFLDAHQKEGVKWILSRSRSYLAHAPGAGKTCQAIVASLGVRERGPTLFIVPPSLTVNWEREILKWTKGAENWYTTTIIPGSDKKAAVDWLADFVICPDSMLAKDWVQDELCKIKFKFIAVDEASRFKEITSERTKALFGGPGKTRIHPGLIYSARHVVLLDGSPMPNRPMELWTPVYAMAPESIDFMNRHEFAVKYCDARLEYNGFKEVWNYRGASNQDELRAKLRSTFMHVVNEDVLNHPERLRSMLFMTDSRTKEMRSWEQKHLGSLTTYLDMPNSGFNDEAASGQGEVAKYRHDLGVSKIDWVAQYVRGRLESTDESIIIFAWHRAVCEGLAVALANYKPGLVVGGTTEAQREQSFRDFQSCDTRLLVGNISAMGRGHNLQKATRIVFAEFSWSDELNKQCEKRASRKGSKEKAIRCEYVVVPGSLDEAVLNSVFNKAKNVKRVIG